MSNQPSREVCPFCHITGEGDGWLGRHLSGSAGYGAACTAVPGGVKDVLLFAETLEIGKAEVRGQSPQLSSPSADEATEKCQQTSRKRIKMEPVENVDTLEHPEGSYSNVTDDSLSMETKKIIGTFFYENGIDFDAAKSPSFRRQVALVFGPQVRIPSDEELKGWILEDSMKDMHQYISEIKSSWAQTGCSILLDGWTSMEGQFLLNILVDCPRGALYLRTHDISDLVGDVQAMVTFVGQVIEEVGANNVVQIITNSTSAIMKEIGKEVMEEHPQIFWTVDGENCIELMLENYGAMVSETLEKAKTITRFIHGHSNVLRLPHDRALIVQSKSRLAVSFFTLENIVAQEKTLKSILLSSASQTSTDEGKRVADLVRNKSFWSTARSVLIAAIPLVRTFEWMRNSKLHMDCIYETLDQAKETIRAGFNKTSKHKPFWEAIDDVWNNHLFSPLHAAGYYFNPNILYTSDAHIDHEILPGLFTCIHLTVESRLLLRRVSSQLDDYRNGLRAFAAGRLEENRSNISAVDWWSRYGVECPELQRLAIRVLSQTCHGSSKFKFKRTLAETLIKKGRNQVEQQRLNELASVHYNMHLKNFTSGRTDNIPSVGSDPADDWTVGPTQT